MTENQQVRFPHQSELFTVIAQLPPAKDHALQPFRVQLPAKSNVHGIVMPGATLEFVSISVNSERGQVQYMWAFKGVFLCDPAMFKAEPVKRVN